jgi:histone H3/H4
MTEKFVVRSAVRNSLKGKFNVSEEFLNALDSEVASLVQKASKRAEGNGRRTLKARDA